MSYFFFLSKRGTFSVMTFFSVRPWWPSISEFIFSKFTSSIALWPNFFFSVRPWWPSLSEFIFSKFTSKIHVKYSNLTQPFFLSVRPFFFKKILLLMPLFKKILLLMPLFKKILLLMPLFNKILLLMPLFKKILLLMPLIV